MTHADTKPPLQELKPKLFDNTKSGVHGKGVAGNSNKAKACRANACAAFLDSGCTVEGFAEQHSRDFGVGTMWLDGDGGGRSYKYDSFCRFLREILRRKA